MITFVSAWYILKAKFDKKKYEEWFSNFLSNVKMFNLVIYTNKESKDMLLPYISNNHRIKLVIKPINEFYNYKYKTDWERNHRDNYLLNKMTGWELNMLWSEKTSFVKDAMDNEYFSSDWYGWCDIGYFRGRYNDIKNELIGHWPNQLKIQELDKTKIHYGVVNSDVRIIKQLRNILKDKTPGGLSKVEIPHNIVCVAGGFFMIYKEMVNEWKEMYDKTLANYFKNKRLVKDDQIIILDCWLNNYFKFKMYTEKLSNYDNWFMFQRHLL